MEDDNRKNLGQHFLIDYNIIFKIIEACNVGKNDVVLEFGTGYGYLTKKIAETVRLVYTYEIDKLEPIVAKPFSPGNISIARELQGTEIDKAYIGSCTGAKLEDLRLAAKLLKGKKVKVRTEVLPAAQSIYMKAMKEGLVSIFMEAGAVIGPPTCGACCGAHMGVLGKDEICVSTTNRNFPGRMGHVESKTYLASPLVVAASAITGKITDPRDTRN